MKSKQAYTKSQTLDYLASVANSLELAEIASAFANANGGSIFLGINQKGKIIGCNPEEEKAKLMELAANFCVPIISFQTETLQENMRLLLEVKISKNEQKNQQVLTIDSSWRKFVRVACDNIEANKIMENYLQLQRSNSPKTSKLNSMEEKILSQIANSPRSLSQLYKIIDLEKGLIDNSVAQLLFKEKINIVLDEKKIVQYSLAKS